MSIENYNEPRLPREKSEITKRELLVASTNIIDQIGTVRTGETKRLVDATWDDDQQGMRFKLQSRTIRSLGNNLFTTFFLQTYIQFTHDPFECYKYNSEGELYQCHDDWQVLEDPDSQYEVASRVREYLASAPLHVDTDIEAGFHDIVAKTVLGDQWFQRRAKRIGLTALFQGHDRAVNRLVRRTNAKEPLLSEDEIRRAINIASLSRTPGGVE